MHKINYVSYQVIYFFRWIRTEMARTQGNYVNLMLSSLHRNTLNKLHREAQWEKLKKRLFAYLAFLEHLIKLIHEREDTLKEGFDVDFEGESYSFIPEFKTRMDKKAARQMTGQGAVF